MTEVVPIKFLRDEDSLIFGKYNVILSKLLNFGFPVAAGVVVTPPNMKLVTTLEHFDFGLKEVFEQNLVLFKKEIEKTPVPKEFSYETKKIKHFLLAGEVINSLSKVWSHMLNIWVDTLRDRLWDQGFYKGIMDNLEPQVVSFVEDVKAWGLAYFDQIIHEVIVDVKFGKISSEETRKISELNLSADNKLFLPHVYYWIVDKGIKIVKVQPYTQPLSSSTPNLLTTAGEKEDFTLGLVSGNQPKNKTKSAVKVFADLSVGLTIVTGFDGVYIASEKIFNVNIPRDSLDEMIFKVVEVATSIGHHPLLFKLADVSEGMGQVRGSLRLLHQDSLFDPLCETVLFARHKKGLRNVHIVVPFVRSVDELLQIKRNLASKKLIRKNSLQIWLELATPENIINLEEYLAAGLDGLVLNIDELLSHFSGFDYRQEELSFYKKEVSGLVKLLQSGIKTAHKFKLPILVQGSNVTQPQMLEFLVENGVLGLIIERYEVDFVRELLRQVEKKVILKRSFSEPKQ